MNSDKKDYIDAAKNFLNAVKSFIVCVGCSLTMYWLIQSYFVSPEVEPDLPKKIIMGIFVVCMAFGALITFFCMLLYLVAGIFALKKDEYSQQKAGKILCFIGMIPAILSDILRIFGGLTFVAFPIVGILIVRRQGGQIDPAVYVAAVVFCAFAVWCVVECIRDIIRKLKDSKEVMNQQ